jgi:hypothetical protein
LPYLKVLRKPSHLKNQHNLSYLKLPHGSLQVKDCPNLTQINPSNKRIMEGDWRDYDEKKKPY